MKPIAERIWHEPAAAIGLAFTVVLVVIAVATGAPWDASTITGIIAPLLSALGIRQLVTPVGPGIAPAQEPQAPQTPPQAQTPPPAPSDERPVSGKKQRRGGR